MDKTQTATFRFNGKTLSVFCASFGDVDIPSTVFDHVKDAFEALSPYIQNDNQVLYIRDIAFLTIENKYPSGYCYNTYEAMIALTSWDDNDQHIKGTINHELHHMARWQNPGYGETLGGAILSEGIALYYEELRSGWLPPLAQSLVTNDTINDAIHSWDDASYNHNEWFYDGPYGKWIGYGIGYRLARQLFKDGFDLTTSVHIKPSDVKQHMKSLLRSN